MDREGGFRDRTPGLRPSPCGLLLLIVGGAIAFPAAAVRAQDTSRFFDGFEGSWDVRAAVRTEAGFRQHRILEGTVLRGEMDRFERDPSGSAKIVTLEIVLTGRLPRAFAMDCPETFGVPLPCETRFVVVCLCDGGEEWLQQPFLRVDRPHRQDVRTQSVGRPDTRGMRLLLKRETGGRIRALDVWTKGEEGFTLRHLRVLEGGHRREVAALRFQRRVGSAEPGRHRSAIRAGRSTTISAERDPSPQVLDSTATDRWCSG